MYMPALAGKRHANLQGAAGQHPLFLRYYYCQHCYYHYYDYCYHSITVVIIVISISPTNIRSNNSSMLSFTTAPYESERSFILRHNSTLAGEHACAKTSQWKPRSTTQKASSSLLVLFVPDSMRMEGFGWLEMAATSLHTPSCLQLGLGISRRQDPYLAAFILLPHTCQLAVL